MQTIYNLVLERQFTDAWWPLSRQCEIRWHVPDGLTALGMLSVTHILPVLVLLSVVGVGMQQCMIQNHVFNI